ncbi:hypothetical protein N7499_007497 [Penicillium canescens]|nr:hypothetical protein N7499_007497 [Penicillium canescens]
MGKSQHFKSWKRQRSCLLFSLDGDSTHGYLPTQGNVAFIHHTQKLIFEETQAHHLTLLDRPPFSGTRAHYLGAQILDKHLKPRRVWIPDAISGNHEFIWNMICESMDQGMRPLHVRVYPYHNKEIHSLEFDNTMRALEEAEADDVLLLHACAHNSTGIDPTRGQWKTLRSRNWVTRCMGDSPLCRQQPRAMCCAILF